jgi:hypothetical protein
MAIIYDHLSDRRLGHLLRRRSTRQEEPVDMYRVEDDVIETLPDGRTIQVAAKGTEIPIGEARKLGLIKDTVSTGPSEVKEPTPAETKKAKE